MISGILGRKIGMTHIFNDERKMVPVTVIQAGPVYITQIKTVEKDGYSAIQVGFEEKSDKSLTFPKYGHLKKAGVKKNLRILKEFRVESIEGFELGQEINLETFEAGAEVVVSAKSKGRGFQGVVKRHGFAGQQKTHGFRRTLRTPMSNGATDAARVLKGSKRPGQMGNKKVTQPGLKIVQVDIERNLLLVDGSIPGSVGGLVEIKKVGK